MSFFEIFFTAIGIFLLLAFLQFFYRFLWPFVRQFRALYKAQRDFLNRSDDDSDIRRESRREGEVTVERTARSNRTIVRDGIGETVEYEEVE